MEKFNRSHEKKRKLKLVEKFDYDDFLKYGASDNRLEGNWNYPGVSGDLDHDNLVDFKGIGPKNYTRSDERIYEEVCEVLMKHKEIDASNIGVLVDKGIVHLSGRVQNQKMKKTSEFIIENLSGVKSVKNELSVIRGVDSERGPEAATKKDLGLS